MFFKWKISISYIASFEDEHSFSKLLISHLRYLKLCTWKYSSNRIFILLIYLSLQNYDYIPNPKPTT